MKLENDKVFLEDRQDIDILLTALTDYSEKKKQEQEYYWGRGEIEALIKDLDRLYEVW